VHSHQSLCDALTRSFLRCCSDYRIATAGIAEAYVQQGLAFVKVSLAKYSLTLDQVGGPFEAPSGSLMRLYCVTLCPFASVRCSLLGLVVATSLSDR
jgi:hypothetical protein